MTLKEALGLKPGEILSLVGAGGKTTTLFCLANEFYEEGKKVLATTTTKIAKPTRPHVHKLFLAQDLEALLKELDKIKDPMIIGVGYGLDHSLNNVEKLVGLPLEWFESLRQKAGLDSILVEADGAASRLLKVPAEYEPVVPESSSLTVWVMAIKVLGRPLHPEWVHRAERGASLLGVQLGTPVTESHIIQLVKNPLGCLKGIPAASRKVALINQADTAEEVNRASSLGRALIREGLERVLVTSYLDQDPIKEIITS